MFTTVIWATDGSETAERALPYALSMLEPGGALLAVHVTDRFPPLSFACDPPFADDPELERRIRAQVEELCADGVDATLMVVRANASRVADAIAQTANDQGAEVIVIGTHAYRPAVNLTLGSITHRLLHIARCPVFAVPASTAALTAAGETRTATLV
jgi:nucleotide-binding universal stress UspA family protein